MDWGLENIYFNLGQNVNLKCLKQHIQSYLPVSAVSHHWFRWYSLINLILWYFYCVGKSVMSWKPHQLSVLLVLIRLMIIAFRSYIKCILHISPDSKVPGVSMGPSGADRTQVGPMLAPWTLLSGSLIRYILPSMCLSLSPFYELSFMQSMSLWVFSLPISLLMILRTFLYARL